MNKDAQKWMFDFHNSIFARHSLFKCLRRWGGLCSFDQTAILRFKFVFLGSPTGGIIAFHLVEVIWRFQVGAIYANGARP